MADAINMDAVIENEAVEQDFYRLVSAIINSVEQPATSMPVDNRGLKCLSTNGDPSNVTAVITIRNIKPDVIVNKNLDNDIRNIATYDKSIKFTMNVNAKTKNRVAENRDPTKRAEETLFYHKTSFEDLIRIVTSLTCVARWSYTREEGKYLPDEIDKNKKVYDIAQVKSGFIFLTEKSPYLRELHRLTDPLRYLDSLDGDILNDDLRQYLNNLKEGIISKTKIYTFFNMLFRNWQDTPKIEYECTKKWCHNVCYTKATPPEPIRCACGCYMHSIKNG
jgi:hypothetical protein